MAHKLKFNISNSNIIIFSPRVKLNSAKELSVTRILNRPLKITSECKNLGPWFDENLRFTKHGNYLCQFAYFTIKQFYPSTDRVKIKTL